MTAIKSSSNSDYSIRLLPGFDSLDYDRQIVISAKKVTIEGGGAVLDASQKGSFFLVNGSSTLTLRHLTLQNGKLSVSARSLLNSAKSDISFC